MNRAETLASNIVGGCLVAALLGMAGCVMTNSDGWLVLAIVSAFLLVPVGAAANAYGTRAFRPFLIAAALLGACGTAAALLSFTGMPLSGLLYGVFLLGTVVFAWGANILASRYA